jgi:hypothetical protein
MFAGDAVNTVYVKAILSAFRPQALVFGILT